MWRCLSFCLLILGEPVLAQQTSPVFRSTTRLVVQPVTVQDGNGRALEGLTAEDFVITEDGQPQQVAFAEFQRIDERQVSDTPAVENLGPSTSPAAVSARTGSTVYANRRLLALFFDLSTMPVSHQDRVLAGARRYLERDQSQTDAVAIMTYENGVVRTRQEFTTDRRILLEALDAVASDAGDGEFEASAFGENDADFNVFSTDRQLAALQTGVERLSALSVPVSLVYFSSGLRLNGHDNQAQLRATINAAVRANVTINPVDARGLVATSPLGDASRRSPGGTALFSGVAGQALLTRLQDASDAFHALGRDTGGRVFQDNNDLSLGIVQTAAAVTSYYLVAYTSTNMNADGKFRRVRITLRDARAARLTYRQGYYAAKLFGSFTSAEKERQLEEALRLEDPITQIRLAVEVDYFQLNPNEYFLPVSVKLPGSELSLAERRGAARTTIDVIGEVRDEHGVTYRTMRDRLDFNLKPEIATEWASRPIHYATGFTLLPGRYLLKILARDATTGRIGTYVAPFVVPNLVREAFPISSVILSGQRVPLTGAVYSVKREARVDAANPLVQGGHMLIPSVTRVFRSDAEMYFFAQAYERDVPITNETVAFVSFFRDGLKVFETTPVLLAGLPAQESKAVPITVTVPTGSLLPGTYDWQLTVLHPASQRAAFSRAGLVVR